MIDAADIPHLLPNIFMLDVIEKRCGSAIASPARGCSTPETGS